MLGLDLATVRPPVVGPCVHQRLPGEVLEGVRTLEILMRACVAKLQHVIARQPNQTQQAAEPGYLTNTLAALMRARRDFGQSGGLGKYRQDLK